MRTFSECPSVGIALRDARWRATSVARFAGGDNDRGTRMALEQQPAHAAAGEVPQDEANTPLRFVTAASLFDGHDAAINIMRRILQSLGTEVIHLGHDRSAAEVVRAAIEEDAHGIAVSSYQGG